ncbi:MAG: dTDP-4-dehydrorhamnose reductase [Rhodanobacteraceae bacterium]|jgi:dTDP-4-dehydrorhamnose reductase|nr:MAG: dTDP-4-dehydrorhamnose reductase [Rhodanobacteraceae bacterium]
MQPIKILVTGANGQVGHELLRALAIVGGPEGPTTEFLAMDGSFTRLSPLPRGPTGSRLPPLLQGDGRVLVRWDETVVIPATRSGKLDDGTRCECIDLADLESLRAALDRIAPHLIVNAAAYTAVDRAEDESGPAMCVNGDALGVLGGWAARHEARVVHYSTDYVFDGSATEPYRENDATHPLGVYGRSKLAGEIALRASGARHLIFRTAWVYAARGHNFLRTMLRLGAERDELRVVDDQIGAPTPARLIADVTAQVIAQWLADDASARDGIYHLVASGQTSWCGFARAIFERARHAGVIERALRIAAIRTTDYPTKAVRPAYSVLDTSKLRAAFGVELPDWQTSLDRVIDELACR